MNNKNTIYIKKSKLDQFYTSEDVAKLCYNIYLKYIDINNTDIILEPSAGNGSFYKLLPENIRVGLDLEPQYDGIIKQDFFNYTPEKNKIINVIGNPPFGRNCSLAVKFFNRCAEFSDTIGFIIPKTFKKDSLKEKLNINFKLKKQIDLPKNSFIFNHEIYDVPCCFQIWCKSDKPRKIKKISMDNDYFIFSSKEDSDFVIRRVGGQAGKAFLDIDKCSKTSNYFLKVKKKSKLNARQLVDIINSIDFSKIVDSTAGVRSLSKKELIVFFKRKLK